MESEQIKVLSHNNETLTIGINDRIDTSNAPKIEEILKALLLENEYKNLIFDFSDLEYISSVGIRILLKIAKNNPNFKIENTPRDIYQVLEMTGINTIIPISKKLREISVKDSEKIGAGFNGSVYRLDDETIVKVMNTDNLDAINNERNLAQKAFLMGIPTAISFDIVKVDDKYGIVYELLNSESYQTRIQNNKGKITELGKRFGQFAREINTIVVDDDSIGSAKDRLLTQLEMIKLKLGTKRYESVKKVLTALPEGDNFIHGDFQPANIVVQNDEPLLIDMATAGKGHPIIELMSLATVIVGSVYSHPEDDYIPFVNDLTKAQNLQLYDAFLRGYFNTQDSEYLEKIKKIVFPFMLATKAMGMANYLPEPNQERQNVIFSEDNETSRKVATLGLNGIINEIDECLDDMDKSFIEIELPVNFNIEA